MKAERRHELKENDLLHALSMVRAYLDENGKQIGIAILVVGIIAVVVALGVRSRAATVEGVWRRKAELLSFDQNNKLDSGKKNLEALAAVTREVSDPSFVLTSLVDQGTEALRLAQEAPAPPDRVLTRMAGEAFEELRRRFPDNPMALGLAYSGLASVQENMFLVDGNLDHRKKAEEFLTAISSDPRLDGLPFKRLAMDRLAGLSDTFAPVVYGAPKEPAAAPAVVPVSVEPIVAPAEPAKPPPTQEDPGEKVPGAADPPQP